MCVSPTAPHPSPGSGPVPRSHEPSGTSEISRRRFLKGAAATVGAAAAIATSPAHPAAAALGSVRPARAVDLTHQLSPTFPMYPVFSPPTRHPAHLVETSGFYMQHWQLWEHTSTHLDAPCHFSPGGRTVPEIGLDELVDVPLCVIDISARASVDPDAVIEVADLRAYEAEHGRIPAGAAVVMNSGWDARVSVPGAYQNPGPDGRLHFPGWTVDAAEWLLDQREVRGIGVDTLSLDEGRAVEEFPVHQLWLGADRWALECVANVGSVPPSGARLFVGVANYEEASGAPCRVVALTQGGPT